ncbi:hypothetical protein BMS3Abin07_00480 [bacterium BMS3Abin07]|nr:hypothetical protein BMS3Abin07_00480 [bacterium BMS3Abin07]GBE31639.1 hypothetical protein BMS3Bbin05_00542 [bacterium BMS3Bbin05]HDO21329.1 hypothetical protein [Nitrospirota bacterium]HDZ87268.1 hypothetical protein [Nitrospirota bacterium]
MSVKKLLTLSLTLFLNIILCSTFLYAGERVFGYEKVIIEKGHSLEKEFQFTVPGAKGKYWLNVQNGNKDGYQVNNGFVWLNGERVVTPKDFHRKVSKVTKDVYLKEDNTLTVKVRGREGSFVKVSIYKAELNLGVDNRKMDLSGINDGPPYGIRLYWERDDRAEKYIFYRAYSMDGPWERIYSIGKGFLTGAAADSTPYLTEREHCYRVEAVDKRGQVIRRYEPICVPPYRTEE